MYRFFGNKSILKGTFKLHRTKKEIIPIEGEQNILITSALPYVNNVPHLGNLIGSVLSADVYARYCRLRGYNVLYICGTDEYGTATETKALQESKTPREICDSYYEIHRQVYEWFDIDFDYFGRTSTSKHTEISQSIFSSLYQKGYLLEQETSQAYCPSCTRFLADRFVKGKCPSCHYEGARGDQCDQCSTLLSPEDLINAECAICKSSPVYKQSSHIFLDLPKLKPLLEKWLQQNRKEHWSNSAVATTEAWLNCELKPRAITRDLKWGVPVPIDHYSDKVMYVWFEAPIGYISITANYTENWERWWKNSSNVQLVQFMGKDNTSFHTIMFPSSLLGTHEDFTLLNSVSTTEYLNYENAKFSKSLKRGVFGTDAISLGIPNEVFRFYLMLVRPENSDTVFKWGDLQAAVNNKLIGNIGNFCNRVLQTLAKNKLKERNDIIESDYEYLVDAYNLVKKYTAEMQGLKLRNGLFLALKCSDLGNKYMQEQKLWEIKDSDRYQTVLFVATCILRLIALLIEPFIPSFSAKLYHMLGIQRTQKEEKLLEFIMKEDDPLVILRILPNDIQVQNPMLIVKPLRDEEIKELINRF